jgi:hypothetical protein
VLVEELDKRKRGAAEQVTGALLDGAYVVSSSIMSAN